VDTLRFTIGFLIAPLAIPAIVFRPWELAPIPYYVLPALFLVTIVAYAGTFLFGIPAYLFLRAKKWTAFWFAPIAGFIVASLTWCLLGIFAVSRGGWDLLDVHGHLDWLRGVLWPFGPLGALFASLLWVMARLERAGSQGGP
jgi:hypothetical protein